MAKLKMLKIRMAAMLSDSKYLIERLQRRGVVELKNVESDAVTKLNTSSSIAVFERNLMNANSALEILNKYGEKKKSLLDGLVGKDAIKTKKFAEKTEKETETVSAVSNIISLDRKIASLNDDISKRKIQIETLIPWSKLDIKLNFRGTAKTAAILGSFAKEISESGIEEIISAESGINAVVENIGVFAGETFSFIVVPKENYSEALSYLRSEGFNELKISTGKTPIEIIADEKDIIKEDELKISEAEDKLRLLYEKKPDIEFLIDFLSMRIDKYNAISQTGVTEKTIIIEGYIPEKYSKPLAKEFEEKYKVFISFSEPEEDEVVPVLLENSAFSAPLEGITKMYAMPGKKDIDPSSVMAFFYYLLFGMMLSDAGYGLLMALGCFFILKKFEIKEDLRKMLTLFRNCGVSTFIWGVLFGSWFGDLPQVIMTNFFGWEDFSTALWFEPLDDPITLLLFSFGIGIIHLFIGLGAHFYTLWKDGKKIDAVCEVIPTYITIIGVMPLGASVLTSVPAILTKIGTYFLIVGAVLVVLTSGRTSKNFLMRIFGGLYGLYNLATGYLGDILSYSRLLALGLATGSIASVINLIATMPENKILKLIMLIVVGILGHAANMAINVLGAYVHTDRLQFVELFSKFYEGGGREFHPLKANTKSFKFEKENIYND